jgi:hypothetical protein
MNDDSGKRLHELLRQFLEGNLSTDLFCEKFESAYNFDVDKSKLSDDEATAFRRLFDAVVWYSPIESERNRIPNYLDEEGVSRVAAKASRLLSGEES